MSADFMAVDPFNNFATGSRLIETSEPHLCQLWDIRFLQGGAFSGGTDLVMGIDPPSVLIEVFDETGAIASWPPRIG